MSRNEGGTSKKVVSWKLEKGEEGGRVWPTGQASQRGVTGPSWWIGVEEDSMSLDNLPRS